jgi:hypothetical protein
MLINPSIFKRPMPGSMFDILCRKKAVYEFLSLAANDNEAWSRYQRGSPCCYSHSHKLMHRFGGMGLFRLKKEGRSLSKTLTPKGRLVRKELVALMVALQDENALRWCREKGVKVQCSIG